MTKTTDHGERLAGLEGGNVLLVTKGDVERSRNEVRRAEFRLDLADDSRCTNCAGPWHRRTVAALETIALE